MSWLTAVAVFALIVLVVGRSIQLPYYTISPGNALNLMGQVDNDKARISVERRQGVSH